MVGKLLCGGWGLLLFGIGNVADVTESMAKTSGDVFATVVAFGSCPIGKLPIFMPKIQKSIEITKDEKFNFYSRFR